MFSATENHFSYVSSTARCVFKNWLEEGVPCHFTNGRSGSLEGEDTTSLNRLVIRQILLTNSHRQQVSNS